ncbi:KAP family P-loop NTPase fold protein [Chitinophaga filiformis]|uniref:KAP family P-loop domain-containing protein n=1 Tax=Chitinophaga filiformis TaxID=104663 RepID=A0A1G7SLE9_CHIFI|nr:P-loop NTPase fold protein [Chitinophaga filiformis]SDG23694.1 KAP family P-loop domain-containing protein [Chitinophaga filiformis]
MELFRPDTPIKGKSEDRFQRYEFASRIADIVSKGKYPQSLVVGIYGKWGEGKSSVINCIHSEINNRYPEGGKEPGPTVIHFNPWIFPDENQLLKIFFTTIAKALGKKAKSKKQQLFGLISTYTESLGIILDLVGEFSPVPMAGKVAKAAGTVVKATKGVTDKFKDDSLESLKERIDKIIIDSGTNMVIFIDDIDRLDIRETQVVFKLVKLLAGFPRTAYVLAFDDELVAKSLAEQYASSAHKQPGYTFLEKIIQIPLHLPKTESSTLRQFALELIQKVHQQINIQLTKKEWAEFLIRFDMAFIPAITNPRGAILYANSIGFVIPLIGKEVNIPDLMLLEAIKTFYPDIYHFIRNNPEHMLRKKEDGERSRQIVADFNAFLSRHAPANVHFTYVLRQLFPLLYVHGSADEDSWFREKRICSAKYFDRYFTYSVQPGEISDVFFNETMNKLFSNDLDTATEYFRGTFSKLEVSTFLYKLNIHSASLVEDQIFQLGLILRNVVGDFVDKDNDELFPTSNRIIQLITSLAKLLPVGQRGTYTKEILSTIQPFEASCEATRSFLGTFVEYLGEKTELNALSTICYEQLVLRYKEFLAADGKLGQLRNSSIWQVLHAYYQTGQRNAVRSFVKAELMINQRFAVRIIQMCSRITYPPSTPDKYELQLLSNTKENIEKLISMEELYNSTSFFYGEVTPGSLMNPAKGSSYDYVAIEIFQKFCRNGGKLPQEEDD